MKTFGQVDNKKNAGNWPRREHARRIYWGLLGGLGVDGCERLCRVHDFLSTSSVYRACRDSAALYDYVQSFLNKYLRYKHIGVVLRAWMIHERRAATAEVAVTITI